jgi:hypothetical protein
LELIDKLIISMYFISFIERTFRLRFRGHVIKVGEYNITIIVPVILSTI